jgi:hypothetical protein
MDEIPSIGRRVRVVPGRFPRDFAGLTGPVIEASEHDDRVLVDLGAAGEVWLYPYRLAYCDGREPAPGEDMSRRESYPSPRGQR